jgi:hypothetical protein
MDREAARQQLMTGQSTDPATWEAYKTIYGVPHQASPEGQAAGGAEAQKAATVANQQPYTNFAASGGNQYYPGQTAVNDAATIEGFDFNTAMNLPSAQGSMQFGLPEGVDPAKYNANQFLTPESGQWLGQQLGWDYTPATTTQSPHFGTMPVAGYFINPDTGTRHGAGGVAQWYDTMQSRYNRQLENYERNLAQNPNIVGTGFLSKPGDPIDRLKAQILGQPAANTNAAGGNEGIYSAIAQGQNAFGDPLGAGGPNAPFTNAPVSPQNPIDQSTQPGVQTQQPPQGDPFAPPGAYPGAGPTGTQDPGYPGWTPTGPAGGGQPPVGGQPGAGGDPLAGGLGPGTGTTPGGAPGGGVPPGSGGGGYGWNPSTGGYGPGSQMPGPGWGQPQNPYQPFNPWMGGQQNPFNPWQGLQGPGGISGLSQLLGNVQSLRNSGYGMFGGWNPMTGFGGGFGPFGGPGGMAGISPYGSLGMSSMGPFGGGQQSMGGYSPFYGGQMSPYGMGGSQYGGPQMSTQTPGMMGPMVASTGGGYAGPGVSTQTPGTMGPMVSQAFTNSQPMTGQIARMPSQGYQRPPMMSPYGGGSQFYGMM